MGKRSIRQRMGFVKQVCRDVFMQTYWELTRAAGDKDQWRGVRMLHNQPWK